VPRPAVAHACQIGMECVEAGFLSYEYVGEAPDVVYSRNALPHLPDAWKAIALPRVADLLKLGGALVLRDIVSCCDPGELQDMLEAWLESAPDPGELQDVLEAWLESAPDDPARGWTSVELEAHVREEYSTFAWLLEQMLRQAGFEIREALYSGLRTHARYICLKS
jgi:hypothetical protein